MILHSEKNWKVSKVLEILVWLLFSSVKFLFAPSAMVASGYNFWEALIVSVSGGLLGVFVFYFSGKAIFNYFSKFKKEKKDKRVFTRKNKMIVKLVNNFGLVGLSAVLGVASIPLTALLAARYFQHRKSTLVYLTLSVLSWGLLLTFFSIKIKPLFI